MELREEEGGSHHHHTKSRLLCECRTERINDANSKQINICNQSLSHKAKPFSCHDNEDGPWAGISRKIYHGRGGHWADTRAVGTAQGGDS